MANSYKRQSGKAGGKAEGLYRLERVGCKVPPFMVLDTDVFAMSIDYISQKIQSDWRKPEVERKIDKWLKDLSADFPTLAVRSSAVGEDGKSHAYPGMLDTVLHVKSKAELMEAIQKVAESIWSERLKTYRREKEITEKLLPAVIIQQQIEAAYSGVLFTTYPVYPNELLIHLVKGFGDKLVSGQADPIEVAFDKASGRVLTSAREDSLPGKELLESLFLKASYLEKNQNQALDIEFCIADDEV
ncbi:MAG TPA: PEP/pyruvate-binding domain-containing protein, partial [Cryomorphaceae bacterium]|nr:PEP/pyruvate-binding domain-containing protein [Cryomorphaceae bacterium]